MYYPYFRGKQYELVTLRECASYMTNKIIPIIEPVKNNLSTLIRALHALIDNDVSYIVIVNPKVGDFKNDESRVIVDRLEQEGFLAYDKLQLGFIIDARTNTTDLNKFVANDGNNQLALIHNGFPNGQTIRDIINGRGIITNIFVENNCGKLYQRFIKEHAEKNILLRDGFLRRKNAEHPEVEHFSELHITFKDENMNGFGDFLIVGDEFMETGGPAYAVAIHITYLNECQDMLIRHFISDRTETPVDPAGKFIEALQKMYDSIQNGEFQVYRSNALEDFFNLLESEHFPGLGFVKKLSMNHHIELIANFLNNN